MWLCNVFVPLCPLDCLHYNMDGLFVFYGLFARLRTFYTMHAVNFCISEIVLQIFVLFVLHGFKIIDMTCVIISTGGRLL